MTFEECKQGSGSGSKQERDSSGKRISEEGETSANTKSSSSGIREIDQSAVEQSVSRPGSGGASRTHYLTETSQLPGRRSNARTHSVSARATPYPVSAGAARALHNSGEFANIPRAAQYHTVGMPARHPLGAQSEGTQSDASAESSADTTPEQSETSSPNEGGWGRPAHQGQLAVVDGRCPICLQTIREAFMSECGHSFCYLCISRHLSERQTCPTCGDPLDREHIYPNFTLNQMIENAAAASNGGAELWSGVSAASVGLPSSAISARSANILQQLRATMESEGTLDASDIDAVMDLLQQKKQSMRKYERHFELAIMRQFLDTAKKKKVAEMEALRRELLCVEEDLEYVAAQTDVLSTDRSAPFAKVSESSNARLAAANSSVQVPSDPVHDDPMPDADGARLVYQGAPTTASTFGTSSASSTLATAAASVAGAASGCGDNGSVDSRQSMTKSSVAAAAAAVEASEHNQQVDKHYDDLEAFYFDSRMRNSNIDRDSNEALDEFLETLTTVARYEKFRQIATLRYGDSTASTAIVASIEFDKDEDMFAVAGVTRKIKLYDYANVVNQADSWSDIAHNAQNHYQNKSQYQRWRRQLQRHAAKSDWWNRDMDGIEDTFVPTAMQYPTAEFTNRSKISCLSFNPYIKSQLACSDYDGAVTLWDVGASTPMLCLDEHEKRAWSVDFSHIDPTRICSGSDDGKVKVWSTNRRASVMTIEGKANVCCVRFNPLHGNILSFGSADHNVHCFDLRSPKQPLCILHGHRKAVSYTRFLSPDEIISASTDSSLKLWNLRTEECTRTFTGHTNEKNFVGLTTSCGEWISCGSENNTMYAYYRNITRPAVTYKFGNCNPVTGAENAEDDPSLFVSAVCWKNNSNVMLSANSQGIIKVLELE